MLYLFRSNFSNRIIDVVASNKQDAVIFLNKSGIFINEQQIYQLPDGFIVTNPQSRMALKAKEICHLYYDGIVPWNK